MANGRMAEVVFHRVESLLHSEGEHRNRFRCVVLIGLNELVQSRLILRTAPNPDSLGTSLGNKVDNGSESRVISSSYQVLSGTVVREAFCARKAATIVAAGEHGRAHREYGATFALGPLLPTSYPWCLPRNPQTGHAPRLTAFTTVFGVPTVYRVPYVRGSLATRNSSRNTQGVLCSS